MHGRKVAMPAWEPGTTARRVIAWLQHSSIVLQGADYPFYRSFLRTLAVQIRYLRVTAAEMPPERSACGPGSRWPSRHFRCRTVRRR